MEPFALALHVPTNLMSLIEFAVIVFGLFAGYWVATQKSQQISAAYRDDLQSRDRFPPGGTDP